MFKNSSLIAVTIFVCICSTAKVNADCTGVASNEVANCGFESGFTDWTALTGTWQVDTTTPRSGTNSAELDPALSIFFEAVTVSDCFPVTDTMTYAFGGNYRIASGSPSTSGVNCSSRLFLYSDACSTEIGMVNGPTVMPTNSAWISSNMVGVDTTGAANALLFAVCTASSSTDYLVLIDDMFAGPDLVPVELMSFSVGE